MQKHGRRWDDPTNSTEHETVLNYGIMAAPGAQAGETEEDRRIQALVARNALHTDIDDWAAHTDSTDDESEDEHEETAKKSSHRRKKNKDASSSSASADTQKGKKRGLLSLFSFGDQGITREDIEKVMKNFRMGLIAKNVAAEIADKVCDSVAASLEGKKAGIFSSLYLIYLMLLTFFNLILFICISLFISLFIVLSLTLSLSN